MTFKARGLYASSSKEPRGFRLGPWLILGAVLVLALVVTTVAAVLGNMDVDRGTSNDSFDAPQTVRIDNRTGGDGRFRSSALPDALAMRLSRPRSVHAMTKAPIAW